MNAVLAAYQQRDRDLKEQYTRQICDLGLETGRDFSCIIKYVDLKHAMPDNNTKCPLVDNKDVICKFLKVESCIKYTRRASYIPVGS